VADEAVAVVVDVWSNPRSERELVENPVALLARHGVPLPYGTWVVLVREVTGAEPELDTQVRYWREALDTDELKLVVPAVTGLGDSRAGRG
jgi:hypothetical protein